MTEQTQPTDAEILDAADDFRSQYKHGGTTFDEFDALGFARAVLAKWGTPAGAGEPVAVIEFTDGVKEPRIMSWNDLPPGQHRVFTTPQPTQAQAAAIPHATLADMHEGLAAKLHDGPARNLHLETAAALRAPAATDPAYSEACSLATALFEKHYRQEPDYASGRVVWSLCDTTAGVISQIDNMVSDLARAPAAGAVAGPTDAQIIAAYRAYNGWPNAALTRGDEAARWKQALAAAFAAAPTPAAQADSQPAPDVDLIARGMRWEECEALMKEACAQAGVQWDEEKEPQSIAINVMQRLANAAHKVGFTLGKERMAAARTPADSALDDARLSQAARDVLAERQRQISAEGWTPEHDDEHQLGELSHAAARYASQAFGQYGISAFWPWAEKWWKPSQDPRRNLEKAGALILAEMERIDRTVSKQGGAI